MLFPFLTFCKSQPIIYRYFKGKFDHMTPAANSLQNRWISGASAIQERVRETRERARSGLFSLSLIKIMKASVLCSYLYFLGVKKKIQVTHTKQDLSTSKGVLFKISDKHPCNIYMRVTPTPVRYALYFRRRILSSVSPFLQRLHFLSQ